MTAVDEDDDVLPLRSTKSPSRLGIHKSKYHIRAAFRCISFLALLAVYGGYHKFYASPVSSQVQNFTNEPSAIETKYVLTDGVSLDTDSMTSQFIGGTSSLPENNGRRLEGLGLCSDMEKADPEWMLVFYIIGVLYMFLALAIVGNVVGSALECEYGCGGSDAHGRWRVGTRALYLLVWNFYRICDRIWYHCRIGRVQCSICHRHVLPPLQGIANPHLVAPLSRLPVLFLWSRYSGRFRWCD
jgi:hypothetical protein